MITLLISTLGLVSAPCCGGGGSLPGLLLGHERVQMSVSGTYAAVVGDTSSSGETRFRSGNDREESYLAGIAGGFLISDRWQMGANQTLGYRSLARPSVQSSGVGLGDLRVHLGYEAFPLWTYSKWRPKGFVFVHANAPLGRSTHDSKKAGAADAFGSGFWSLGLGTIFVKSWTYWDAGISAQAQYSFPETFSEPREIRVAPGAQASGHVGVGVSPRAGPFRLGLRAGPAWRQGGSSKIYGETSSGVYRLVWDAVFEVSVMLGDQISLAANYTDQTILRPTRNTALNRAGGFSVQYRWLR